MTDQLVDQNALEQQMLEINAKIAALKAESVALSKNVFHTAVSNFFNNYPEVSAVIWQQYTPYFNDGDTCEFSVHEPAFLSAADYDAYSEGNLDNIYEYSSFEAPSDWVYKSAANVENKYRQEYQKTIDKYEELAKNFGNRLTEIQIGVDNFHKLFNEIGSDVMLSLFGDHVQVTVTKDGIEVDEYSHD